MSLLQSVRETFRQKTEAKRNADLDQYRALVVDLADDKQRTFEEISQALSAPDPETGESRSVDDLERDVETLKERRQLKEQLDQLPQAQKEKREIEAKRTRSLETYNKAIEKHRQVMEQTAGELQALQQTISAAERGREQLLATCADPRLVASRKELMERRGAASRRRQELKTDLWGYGQVGSLDAPVVSSTGSRCLRYERNIETATNELAQNRAGAKERLQKLKSIYENFRRREVEPAIKEYEDLGDELDQLDRDLAKISEQMLVP